MRKISEFAILPRWSLPRKLSGSRQSGSAPPTRAALSEPEGSPSRRPARAYSLWFFLAEFLKTRIIPERVEDRIEAARCQRPLVFIFFRERKLLQAGLGNVDRRARDQRAG